MVRKKPTQRTKIRPTSTKKKQKTGECKNFMASYLTCMKKVRGVNEDECRELAKAYLSCRMDR
jgi:hypothetical protein